MRSLLACVGPVFVGSLAVLSACVGDSPDPSGGVSSSSSSSGSSGATGSSGTSAEGGASSGAPTCSGDTVEACGTTCVKCTAPTDGTVACTGGACEAKCPGAQVVCGAACVDTKSSAANCGTCGHSCGPGQCTDGTCQPIAVAPPFTSVHAIAASPRGIVISADADLSVCEKPEGCSAATLSTIRAGLSQLNDVTVSGTTIYFDANVGDNEIVYSCPVDGCPGAGPTVVESQVNDAIGRVVSSPTALYWTRDQSYYGPYTRRCVLPGCASITDVRPLGTTEYAVLPAREQVRPSKVVSVGAVSALWATGSLYTTNAKQLRACPLGQACPTPTEVDTESSPVSALTYFDGKHYGASGASGGGSVLFSVSDASPGARALLASDAAGVTGVAVDASGIYWVNGTTGKVLRCATLTGCNGGGETLATGQTGASRIALDEGFVYWMTPTTVLKVAK